MAIENALIKPAVDAIVAVFRKARNHQLNKNAKELINDAIRELLLANPNEDKAAAKIAIAKAAGLISPEALLAETMLKKVRASRKHAVKKAAKKRAKRRAAKKSARRRAKKKA